MRRLLKHCTDQELALLTAMLAIAKQLPRDLIEYTPAIGELSKSFKGGGGLPHIDHNPSRRSLAQSRSVRATERFGQ